MPERRPRVVCGTGAVMAILWPTRRFTSADLPTLGRPARTTKPERCDRRCSPMTSAFVRADGRARMVQRAIAGGSARASGQTEWQQ